MIKIVLIICFVSNWCLCAELCALSRLCVTKIPNHNVVKFTIRWKVRALFEMIKDLNYNNPAYLGNAIYHINDENYEGDKLYSDFTS